MQNSIETEFLNDIVMSDDEYELAIEQHLEQINSTATTPDHLYHRARNWYSSYIFITDFDMLFYQTLDNCILKSMHGSFSNELISAYDTIEYRCFACKTAVYINHKHVTHESFFCQGCKPAFLNLGVRTNPHLLRFMNAFYTMLQNKVLQNELKYIQKQKSRFYDN